MTRRRNHKTCTLHLSYRLARCIQKHSWHECLNLVTFKHCKPWLGPLVKNANWWGTRSSLQEHRSMRDLRSAGVRYCARIDASKDSYGSGDYRPVLYCIGWKVIYEVIRVCPLSLSSHLPTRILSQAEHFRAL